MIQTSQKVPYDIFLLQVIAGAEDGVVTKNGPLGAVLGTMPPPRFYLGSSAFKAHSPQYTTLAARRKIRRPARLFENFVKRERALPELEKGDNVSLWHSRKSVVCVLGGEGWGARTGCLSSGVPNITHLQPSH